MEKSFIFNSINGDRKMKAEDFREYFASLIGNGIFSNPSMQLQVISNINMQIIVKQGKAYINGSLYINTDDLILNIDNADGILDRIDRIVLRMDTVERNIKCIVKKGVYSSNPTAPALQRDADAYELCIAHILVSKGSIDILQSMITDTRLNSELCGIVTQTVETIDTTTLFKKLEAYIDERGQDVDAWVTQATTRWEQDFITWFNTIKDVLNGDIAGALANRITTLENTVNNLKLESGSVMRPNGKNVEESLSANETSIQLQGEEIESLKQSGVDGKTVVASAITAKGVPTLATDEFQQMATNILNIKQMNEGDTLVNIFTQINTPSNPFIGDVWVSTNKTCNNKVISLTEPPRVLGNVWITSNKMKLQWNTIGAMGSNILLSNPFTVDLANGDRNTPISGYKIFTSDFVDLYSEISTARYFNGGAWEYLDVYIYNGNTWVVVDRGSDLFYLSYGRNVPNQGTGWKNTISLFDSNTNTIVWERFVAGSPLDNWKSCCTDGKDLYALVEIYSAQYKVIKYSSDGVSSSVIMSAPDNVRYGIELDSEGNIILAGYDRVYKYSPQGTLIWSTKIANNMPYNISLTTYITVDDNDNIYTVKPYSSGTWGTESGCFSKLNKSGDLLGDKSVGYTASSFITLDENKKCYLTYDTSFGRYDDIIALTGYSSYTHNKTSVSIAVQKGNYVYLSSRNPHAVTKIDFTARGTVWSKSIDNTSSYSSPVAIDRKYNSYFSYGNGTTSMLYKISPDGLTLNVSLPTVTANVALTLYNVSRNCAVRPDKWQ